MENDTHEILAKTIFSEEEKWDIFGELQKHTICPIVYSYIDEIEKFSFCYEACNVATKEFLQTRKGDIRENSVAQIKELVNGDVFYFTCIDTCEKLEPIYKKWKDTYHCIFQQDIYSGEQWLEIIPKHVSKANAILQVKELLNVDYVVAFGDGMNDIEMFEVADECYAVENAVDELKKIATGIIESNEEDGVARWLQERWK